MTDEMQTLSRAAFNRAARHTDAHYSDIEKAFYRSVHTRLGIDADDEAHLEAPILFRSDGEPVSFADLEDMVFERAISLGEPYEEFQADVPIPYVLEGGFKNAAYYDQRGRPVAASDFANSLFEADEGCNRKERRANASKRRKEMSKKRLANLIKEGKHK